MRGGKGEPFLQKGFSLPPAPPHPSPKNSDYSYVWVAKVRELPSEPHRVLRLAIGTRMTAMLLDLPHYQSVGEMNSSEPFICR